MSLFRKPGLSVRTGEISSQPLYITAEGTPGPDRMVGGVKNDKLSGGWGADTIIGNDGNDALNGEGGDDQLFGGGDADTLLGGVGADSLDGGSKGDRLDGGDGGDTIDGGDSQDSLHGDKGADLIFGGEGADWITGGVGYDTLDGGPGDDILDYYGAEFRGVSVDLAAGTADDGRSIDTISGFETVRGSFQADDLRGSMIADYFVGFSGDDRLEGREGEDNMQGNDGADTLIGGRRADVLSGDEGIDTFLYESVADSGGARGQDIIFDLESHDIIDLRAIDADTIRQGNQAFVLVDSFHHKAGELTLSFVGDFTHLEADTNGNGVADFSILLLGDVAAFDNFVL